jgi:hypothetical protein
MSTYIIDIAIVLLIGILISGAVNFVSNSWRRWYFSHYRDVTKFAHDNPIRQKTEMWGIVGYWSGKIMFVQSFLMLFVVVAIVTSSYIK